MVSGGGGVPATAVGWWHGRARRALGPRDGLGYRAARAVARAAPGRPLRRTARPGLWQTRPAERSGQRPSRLRWPLAARRPSRTHAPTPATRQQTATATSCRQSSPRSVASWRRLSAASLLAIGSAWRSQSELSLAMPAYMYTCDQVRGKGHCGRSALMGRRSCGGCGHARCRAGSAGPPSPMSGTGRQRGRHEGRAQSAAAP
eukprot:scaffold23817_cov69-Phaeocystis_antarctica.AAC.3